MHSYLKGHLINGPGAKTKQDGRFSTWICLGLVYCVLASESHDARRELTSFTPSHLHPHGLDISRPSKVTNVLVSQPHLLD
jgi:hypothetical protein